MIIYDSLRYKFSDFVKELLFNIGTHVDPIKLIKRIKNGMKIPSLRDALVKILQDYNLQVSLHEGSFSPKCTISYRQLGCLGKK